MRYDPERHLWAALSVPEAHELLCERPAKWWLSGGWAIDHWLGTATRPHGDLDISTLRPELPVILASLPSQLRPFAAMSGSLFPLADRIDDPELRNIWLYDEDQDRWVLQINLEAGDHSVWRYRRDPQITLQWDQAVRRVRSVPTGTPITQLLWKSRDPRPQDEHDLSVMHGLLQPAERRWLHAAVRTAHPQSLWVNDSRL